MGDDKRPSWAMWIGGLVLLALGVSAMASRGRTPSLAGVANPRFDRATQKAHSRVGRHGRTAAAGTNRVPPNARLQGQEPLSQVVSQHHHRPPLEAVQPSHINELKSKEIQEASANPNSMFDMSNP